MTGECWAGNSYGKYGKRPDHECDKQCRYDEKGRMCGGPWRNSIFDL